MTELNPPLRFLKPEQRVEISPEDAERLGVSDGERCTVGVGTGPASRRGSAVRERMRDGAVFLIEGTAEGNANALLNGGGERGRGRRRSSAADLIEVAE